MSTLRLVCSSCQPVLIAGTSDKKYRFGVPFKVLSLTPMATCRSSACGTPSPGCSSFLFIFSNIQFNNLREILPGTFNGSQVSFRTINLQNNMIEVVHPGAFDGVVHRGFIDLSLNELARVKEGSLVTSYSSV